MPTMLPLSSLNCFRNMLTFKLIFVSSRVTTVRDLVLLEDSRLRWLVTSLRENSSSSSSNLMSTFGCSDALFDTSQSVPALVVLCFGIFCQLSFFIVLLGVCDLASSKMDEVLCRGGCGSAAKDPVELCDWRWGGGGGGGGGGACGIGGGGGGGGGGACGGGGGGEMVVEGTGDGVRGNSK